MKVDQRLALDALSKQSLRDVTEEFGFDAPSYLRKYELVEFLARSKRASFERILGVLRRDDLKAICRAAGIDETGIRKDDLVDRILGRETVEDAHWDDEIDQAAPEPQRDEDEPEQNETVTSAEPAQVEEAGAQDSPEKAQTEDDEPAKRGQQKIFPPKDDQVLLDDHLICTLTGEARKATSDEETLQSLVEQLHREYEIALEDMERDLPVPCVIIDQRTGAEKTRRRRVSLAVFEPGSPHEIANVTHVAMVAKGGTKATSKNLEPLAEVLSNLSEDRDRVYGVWTNGGELKFQMRYYDPLALVPAIEDLADFPAPHESLEDLEDAERRPLRTATGDSLLRAFKRCHDYLYGNQSMRGDRAFWQLLYLIFAKIHDEKGSRRKFFVGAREANSDEGREKISQRIKALFDEVKDDVYKDVFDGNERIELNDRALAFVAGELSRYNLLATDTDAKGTAYEAITSTTLKRERGQFFTPRNVIRMMVDMASPDPGEKVLDPACGSGGFLVVTLAHVRRKLLAASGCPYPDKALPSELKLVDGDLRDYARACLYGVDVDPELRKAARMNMVMNNDGHGNVFQFNALEYGIPELANADTGAFVHAGGGHGEFDYVFTNPPFGAKIPVEDPNVLRHFDLGHTWKKNKHGGWDKGQPQKKVPPEILFIEACYKFLKPGTGVLAIVVPNGILGNPGEQMEFVRWWMLRNTELLASVDLPAEAFLPQVSVQASCIFLRRRYDDEFRFERSGEGLRQRPVFMAIAEKCGHGRRGEVTYVRNPDGTERIEEREVVERWERNGKIHEEPRKKKERDLADDLPWIAEQYRKHAAGETFEESHG